MLRLTWAALLALAAPAYAQTDTAAQTPQPALPELPSPPVAQLFAYRLSDRAAFETGYRQHLQWHAQANDQLAWYAWYVTSGERIGTFIDGTFGASFAQLDARPDLPGDGADFARTAGPHATATAMETWQLWQSATTATPLEQRQPPATLDIFRIDVAPANAAGFEAAIEQLARGPRGGATVAWYRLLRGGTLPSYLLIVPRSDWAGIALAGGTLPEMLSIAYGAPAASAQSILNEVAAIRSETWSYAPRLALIPGTPLAP